MVLLPRSLQLHPRSAIFELVLEYLSLGNGEGLILVDHQLSIVNFVLSNLYFLIQHI